MADGKILSLLVGIPAYGGLNRAEQIPMFFELGHAFATAEDRFRFAGIKMIDSQPIDRVRNMLLAAAVEVKADWLLMIDSDVWVRGTDEEPAGFQLLRMISQSDRLGAAVVGANVYRRGGEGLMTYTRSPTTNRLLTLGGFFFKNTNELTAVDAIGTSIFAINLRAIDYVDGFAEPFKFACGVSEDLYFCEHVLARGGKIFVDPRVRTSHMSRPQPLEWL